MLQMYTLTNMLEFNDYDEMAACSFHREMKKINVEFSELFGLVWNQAA